MGVSVLNLGLLISLKGSDIEAAEREVMFPKAPLGIGKNYLIHSSDLLYLFLFHDHYT